MYNMWLMRNNLHSREEIVAQLILKKRQQQHNDDIQSNFFYRLVRVSKAILVILYAIGAHFVSHEAASEYHFNTYLNERSSTFVFSDYIGQLSLFVIGGVIGYVVITYVINYLFFYKYFFNKPL